MQGNCGGELGALQDRIQGMDASGAARYHQRATVTVDRDGIIHQWGDAVAELMGYSANETVGLSLDVVIPAALRPLHWWGFDRAMTRGSIGRGMLNVPALRKDGRLIVARATIELIRNGTGKIDTVAVTFTGVAPRWQESAWKAVLASVDLAARLRKRHCRERWN